MTIKLRPLLAALSVAMIVWSTAAAGLANADPTSSIDDTKLLLVLDVSGSMKEDDASGDTKMEAAKKALTEVIANLPDNAQVGLRVYGATVQGGKPTPEACADTQLVQPIGTVDKAALTKTINDFEPKGETPIAYSLEKSLEDVGDTGKRNVILVSDGEESCDPDPCDTVKKLIGSGVDLQIDTVGLAVNSKAKKQLTCIAEAGNGTYYAASDADDLVSSLTRLSTRAMQPFTIMGEPVTAGRTAETAPEITAGQYTDEISSDPDEATEYWYKIRRNLVGSTVHASLVGRLEFPDDVFEGISNGGWGYKLFASDKSTQCDWTQEGTIDTMGYGMFASGLVQSKTLNPAKNTGRDQACASSEYLYFRVERQPSTATPVAVEIKIVEEPSVSNVASLPPALKKITPNDNLEAPKPGTASQAVGGFSFNDAPVIGPGTYTTEIVPGERVFFRTHLDWGQSAIFAVNGPQLVWPPNLGGFAKARGVLVAADLYSPERGILNGNVDSTSFDEDGNTYNDLVYGVPEIRYQNRWGAPEIRNNVGYSSAGDYYYSISLGTATLDGKFEGVAIPVEFTISVTGEVTGVPEYSTPFSMTEAQAPSIGSYTPQANSSASPSGDPSQSASAVATPTEPGAFNWRVVLLGGGSAILIIVATTVLLVARRRGNAGTSGQKQ